MGKFTIIVETVHGNSALNKNSLFVISKLIYQSIQCICCKHTLMSDTLMFRKNNFVLHPLRAGNGDEAQNRAIY